LDRWYNLETRTESIDRNNTRELAILRENGKEIWRERIVGGGENEQYKKVGAYRLTGGSGRAIVEWDNMRFYTGER